MLNKFKNVLYGSSSLNGDGTPSERLDRCRSLTFREDLEIKGANWNNNNNNNAGLVGLYKGKLSGNQSRLSDDIRIPFLPKDSSRQSNSGVKVPKFHYSRPEFLQLKTDDEINVSADHQIRPIILPRDVTKLPWKSGYAECINAGKSVRNEDQAVCYQDVIISRSSTLNQSKDIENSSSTNARSKLPWVYFAIFDGHAGNAVAVAAANQLHNLIGEKLQDLVDLLMALEFESERGDDDSDEFLDCKEDEVSTRNLNGASSTDKKQNNDINDNSSVPLDQPKQSVEASPVSSNVDENHGEHKQSCHSDRERKPECPNVGTYRPKETYVKRHPNSPERRVPAMTDRCRNLTNARKSQITVDDLIIGALETAFCEMDALIARDKHHYKMPGGCTAIVSLFILGKLYVCNAGDSRAIVHKNKDIIPMSFDFTPTSERERILRLGQQRPEFLGTDFTHLEFLKRPTRRDLGKQMLYKDAYMTGWSLKTITYDDLKFPLVWGEGKRSRVLATIGVTRGFGDHELRAQYGSVPIKPFLTAEPDVRILDLENDEQLTPEDVLIMGSDGLWDVTTNLEAAEVVAGSFHLFPESEESRSKYRYMTAAQDLVIQSRGHTTNWNNVWRTSDDRMASLDDIAVFVIPLKQYRDEYLEWKKMLQNQLTPSNGTESNESDVSTKEETTANSVGESSSPQPDTTSTATAG